jgi:hypothetical protein
MGDYYTIFYVNEFNNIKKSNKKIRLFNSILNDDILNNKDKLKYITHLDIIFNDHITVEGIKCFKKLKYLLISNKYINNLNNYVNINNICVTINIKYNDDLFIIENINNLYCIGHINKDNFKYFHSTKKLYLNSFDINLLKNINKLEQLIIYNYLSIDDLFLILKYTNIKYVYSYTNFTENELKLFNNMIIYNKISNNKY